MGGDGSGRLPNPETIARNMMSQGHTEPQYLFPSGIGGVKPGAKKATAFSDGSVIFIDNGDFAQDNSNLYWDDINNRLGIGTATPSVALAVNGTISGNALRTSEDHSTSGNSAVVGIITHTSATPPTASNYPIGTLYIKYTA